MPLEDVLTLLKARPFVPFRIHLDDGTSWDVRHPEMCMPTARSLVVGIPGEQLPAGVYEKTIYVGLIHVSRLEPLPAAVPGNGQAG